MEEEEAEPVKSTVPFEDLQHNIQKFEAQDKAGAVSSSSATEGLFEQLPHQAQSEPAIGQRRSWMLRASHIAQIGGFRREFLHRRFQQSSMSAASMMELRDSLLVAEIRHQMRLLVRFLGAVEDGGAYEAASAAAAGWLLEDSPDLDSLPDTEQLLRSKSLSTCGACLCIFKSFISTGILFIPQAMTNAGWLSAIVLMTVSAAASTVGILLLGQCYEVCRSSYPEMGRRALGHCGYVVIAGQIAVSQFGFCAAFVGFMQSTADGILRTVGFDSRPEELLCLIIVALVPMAWIEDISSMTLPSTLGNLVIVLAVAALSLAASADLVQAGTSPDIVACAKADQALVFAGTAAYAFEGIAMVIPIRQRMAEPELFPQLLSGMMATFLVILTGFGLLGYLAWGKHTETIVLNQRNGPGWTLLQLLYVLAVFCSFPLSIHPTFSICEQAILGHGRISREQKMTLGKRAFRAALTVAMGVLVYCSSRHLSTFISIVGGGCSIPLAIIFPSLLHLRVVKTRYWLSLMNLVLGTAMLPLTLFADASSWINGAS
eukprot:TRINITY_DN12202_c0_g1_i1.p2 TRINITY_DN12202_c0_g1~~TRINITY_DN12202_c0_g1_i1.p2  ORF type:complete len:565 (-),score=97.70 TRINITY_DN12202_c0_g1_i1:2371-4005(-)